jgi:uncharacterized protein involved in tolerance to divalent cations
LRTGSSERKRHSRSLHPNELPEVIAVDIALGLDRYLDWIGSETQV